MDENKRAAERALIAAPAKHLAELVATSIEVAEVRRPTQGAASGVDNLPASGAASGLDDAGAMMSRAAALGVASVDAVRAMKDAAILVNGALINVRAAIGRGDAPRIAQALKAFAGAEMAVDRAKSRAGESFSAASMARSEAVDAAQIEFNKQKQCRADCRRVGCGCQC